MRTTASSLVSKLRPIYSSKGRWVGTMTPRKQITYNMNDGHMEKANAEPIAAFSRPPPLSPFLGPLVALSMLESWYKQDNNDN
ncbi:hypothetical protein PHJA_001330100 [Phtheirospermum japonicum]|uniref:Uncharacterized protein n=1 Tax=Phtheirospermum japonicum TaxID=374723 RepID=A0A830CCC4_9LAMI|nr:hypothetical protein PHJA_001330100 [Phtheirospermum japonicum]